MATVNIAPTLTGAERILHSISIDSVSGFQTIVDSLNKPAVMLVTEQVPVDEVQTAKIINLLPSAEIVPVPDNKTSSVINNSEFLRKIEVLSPKDKNVIIFGLLGISAILLIIAIFK